MLLFLLQAFLVGLIALFTYTVYINMEDKMRNLPPGPWRLPLIGNLHLTPPTAYLPDVLKKLSQEYGPIYRIWMGNVLNVVITDPELLREAWISRHAKYTDRRVLDSYSAFFPEHKGLPLLFLNPSDPTYKHKKTIVVQKLIKPSLLRTTEQKMLSEVAITMEQLRKDAKAGKQVDMKEVTQHLASNVLTMLAFSCRVFDDANPENAEKYKDFLWAVENMRTEVSKPKIGDYVPLLQFTNIPIKKTYSEWVRQHNHFMQHILNDHKQTLDPDNPRDIMDELLVSLEADDVVMMSEMMSLYIAGSHTTASTIESMIALLMEYPDVQTKLQKEIFATVPAGKPVTNADLKQMPYLHAVWKELTRLMPTSPVVFPRAVNDDDNLAGYNIPQGTLTWANIHTMLKDPKYFDAPNECRPERWLETEDGVHNTKKLPDLLSSNQIPWLFSCGARQCPGLKMGEMEVLLCVTNLLHNFRFSWAPSKQNDSTRFEQVLGLHASLKNPVVAVLHELDELSSASH